MMERGVSQNKDQFLNDFSSLLKNLRSPDPDERKKTFSMLSEMSDPRLIKPCRDLLVNKDPILRFVGCEMLGNMVNYESLPQITNCLRDEDKSVRISACMALARIGDVRSITPLLHRLKDPDQATRKAAFKALEQFGDGRLANAIMEDRVEDLVHIAETGDPRAIDPLLNLLMIKGNGSENYIKKSLVDLFEKYEPEIERMLCMVEFTRFSVFSNRRVKVGMFKRLPVFGCRICRQTISAMTGVRVVIAVIDSKMNSHAMFDDGVLEVNYLVHGSLFDFDKVDIRRIENKKFDKFVNQMAKNPGKLLQKKSTEISCELHRNCGIDDRNTTMCYNMFKKVKISDPVN